ncbi:uncharacterized protein LOC115055732 isoform X2 [Echeneis naucrates]|uniref:uncharacterized protein LOC115055732 isoform X2 n=1 Tax=Echeneis naucrates TaxID=173247 RepID=UPI001113B110|nr:uncharacterized protein LOC115055732 isoform X2 [Echeneis naucrates]
MFISEFFSSLLGWQVSHGGIHSITTVSEVPVTAGKSITIPCLYESKYINHVKYLCKGSTWRSCTYAVRTDKPDPSGKFSISDDKTLKIFTVTIQNLNKEDSYYWCNVEINHGPDDGIRFQLSVTEGTLDLSVDRQQVTGYNGESITISCSHRNPGNMKWCKLGGNCVTQSSKKSDGTPVTTAQDRRFFNVTMSALTFDSSGWYWCAQDKIQMLVHITVVEKPSTTTIATECPSITLNTDNDDDSLISHSLSPKTLIIPLSLLTFIVIVALLIWFILKKYKQSNAKSPAMTMRSHDESDVDLTYTSVVSIKQQKAKEVEGQDNVVYSTLARPNQNA